MGLLWQRCVVGILPYLLVAEAVLSVHRSRRYGEAEGEGEEEESSLDFTEGVTSSMCSRLLGNATMESLRTIMEQRPSTMPTRPAVLYFLHIPKAAGVSFQEDVKEMLGDAMMAYMAKEGCYGWAECAPGAGVVTLLRNPRAHVLSQYVHCATLPTRKIEYRQDMPEFEAWLQKWVELQRTGKAEDDFAPEIPRDARELVASTQTKSPYKCYSPVNMMMQRLTCYQTFNYRNVKQRDLPSVAKTNLQRSWMVGIVEAYEESMCLLYEKVNEEMPASCNCLASKDGRGRPPGVWRHTAHGVAPHRIEDVPEATLGLIDQLTAHDAQIYRQGVRRFVSEMREAEAKYGMKVLCNATFQKLEPYLK